MPSVRHRGLRRLRDEDNAPGVLAEHGAKLRDMAWLDAAARAADTD
jgi:hypothetical protein